MDSSYEMIQVIVVRKDLNMETNKLCDQVARASNMFLLDCMGELPPLSSANPLPKCKGYVFNYKKAILSLWKENGYKKVVYGCAVESELKLLMEGALALSLQYYPVYELNESDDEKILTCVSFGPASIELINKVTGHLHLI